MLSALFWLFILPLKALMGIALELLQTFIGSYGWALVGLSVLVNLALLPAYRLAERWQQAERDAQRKLAPYRTLIKHGAPKGQHFALLRTLYRQQGYHPVYALRASAGLLLQLPFFIAAYQLLSHYPAMEGVAFGPIADLAQSDRLIQLGSWSINLLPLLMTGLNLLAALFYTKEQRAGERIQLYLLSLFFLLLLYQSPAALLLYWSTNNLVALLKYLRAPKPAALKPAAPRLADMPQVRLFSWPHLLLAQLSYFVLLLYAVRYRISPAAEFQLIWWLMACVLCYVLLALPAAWARSRRRLCVLLALLTVSLLLFLTPQGQAHARNLRRLVVLLMALIAALGLLRPFSAYLGTLQHKIQQGLTDGAGKKLVLLSLSLWLVTVFLTNTSALLASSPVRGAQHLWLLYQVQLPRTVVLLVAGLVVFWLLPARKRPLIALFVTLLALLALVNSTLLVGKHRPLNDTFILESVATLLNLSWWQVAIDALAPTLLAALLLLLVWGKKSRILLLETSVLLSVTLLFTGYNVFRLEQGRLRYLQQGGSQPGYGRGPARAPQQAALQQTPFFFSQNRQNVLLIVLDRFVGGFVQHILDDEPQLSQQFSGFTWYPNTVSPSGGTWNGIPSLLGGYEFTHGAEEELDYDRDTQLAGAYGVLLDNFAGAGYQQRYLDPIYDDGGGEDFQCEPFLSKGAECHLLMGRYREEWLAQQNNRYPEADAGGAQNTPFIFGGFRALSPALRSLWLGVWEKVSSEGAAGLRAELIDWWSVLDLLPQLTRIRESPQPQFTFFYNAVPHVVYMMGRDNQPAVDKVKASDEEKARFGDIDTQQHYYTDRASLVALGRWFALLQQQGAYDNTRIMIVSDHGIGVNDPTFNGGYLNRPAMAADDPGLRYGHYHPLMLFKDFNQRGKPTSSTRFAPLPDTPQFVFAPGLEPPVDPVNPLTQSPLSEGRVSRQRFPVLTVELALGIDGQFVLESEDFYWLVGQDVTKPENWQRREEDAP